MTLASYQDFNFSERIGYSVVVSSLDKIGQNSVTDYGMQKCFRECAGTTESLFGRGIFCNGCASFSNLKPV